MKRPTTIILMMSMCLAAQAKLTLSNLCSDGMVLQQETGAKIWGEATPGSQITVTSSWNGSAHKCKTGSDGRWSIRLQTPKGSYRPYSITIKGDSETIKIENVLIGEVWLASGQSNMEMPMRGFFNCPVENAAGYICSAPAKDRLRMFTVPKAQSYEPLNGTEGKWESAEPSTIPNMSATAYFFARRINEVTDMPVGIISCAYGGARVESWIPENMLREHTDENLDHKAIEAMTDYRRPFLMYNAMLCPVKGYSIKGFIWYQGCSNVGSHDNFVQRMTMLIDHWRSCWDDDRAQLPFYMVEIAPYRYKPAGDTSYAALLRKAQHDVASSVPNCGIAVTNDLVESYEMDNIHPAKKKPVGDRLAYLALNRTYGFRSIACDSPEAIKCIRIKDSNELGIVLTNCDNGLSRWMEIEGLEVAGSEGVFYPVRYAYFEWDSKMLRIRSEFVPDPCRVRYGWGDFRPGNLKNVEGLPVSPFDIRPE